MKRRRGAGKMVVLASLLGRCFLVGCGVPCSTCEIGVGAGQPLSLVFANFTGIPDETRRFGPVGQSNISAEPVNHAG
ncbi:hypothetical protein SAMN04488118_10878 [Epibacterium ulvae]|uniref:Uncharacterized protein n=1 Tax=Epibacterium ulvae TaxID=1156985 RepID=A0A1G5R440_9RHOB|nr:hypothetical protein SAMN04488118_10878 [Epibacterium ulvae]